MRDCLICFYCNYTNFYLKVLFLYLKEHNIIADLAIVAAPCTFATTMAAAFPFVQALRFSSTPISLQRSLRSFTLFAPFSSASATVISPHKLQRKKWRQPVVPELGGVKIARDGNLSPFLMWVGLIS